MTTWPDSSEHAPIVALVAELDSAASALDIDRFLNLFVDGPDFAFVFNGAVRATRAEVREFHRAAWSNLRAVAFRTEVGRVAFPAPGVAALSATGTSERTLVSGERRAGTYALTLILTRASTGWRVLQCHESTPALPMADPG